MTHSSSPLFSTPTAETGTVMTHKAFMRSATLAGSGLLWLGLGYLALSYAPQMAKFQIPEPPAIPMEPRVKPEVLPPPPPPEVRPQTKREDVRPVTDAPSTLSERPSTAPIEIASSEPLSLGPVAEGPVVAGPVAQGLDPVPETLPVEPDPVPVQRLIINPVRIAGANPIFPRKALDREMNGEVTLSFTVTSQGKVSNLVVIGESPRGYGFAEAARRAVEAWTFQPQTIDGIAVAYPARYTISFTLTE
ncbi:hypothetical protein PbB2_01899 [Candidatus Phycosocius bacilliformis]|uniref:Protein TonB n=1 Tax=Candidatus Phycosocius bacilliformis TaxID=1445552 RepID=A0A2P2EAY1_9PROT|nr:TonB family protein [Candidatus Phycosocius bacilliformis]GBF58227.1 hypothetical protein PbB2_01899 [Candidatus Phycosocius bacilliformis]